MKITKGYFMKWKAKFIGNSPYHNEWHFYDSDGELVWWMVEWKDIMSVKKTCLWLIWYDSNLLIWQYDWFKRLNEVRELFYKSMFESEYKKALEFFKTYHSKFNS